MALRREILAVYSAGVVQGLALITFPAAASVLTSPSGFGLSSTAYGGLFAPQAVLAVASSLLGAGLRGRFGAKRLYLLGLAADLLAMALFAAAGVVMRDRAAAYATLLAATGFLGMGFGFAAPALNTFASAFSPGKTDKAVLTLNALLGLGTVLAPVFAAVFVGLGFWWGLPALTGALFLGLLGVSLGLPLGEGSGAAAGRTGKAKGAFPALFWAFAAFALLYGVCETMNGNWAVPYMTKALGAGGTAASVALAVFWGLVTGGRVLFAALGKRLPEGTVLRVLPFVVAAAFIATACVPKSDGILGIAAFALAGLGCSALLPLAISFGQKRLTSISASAAGGLIAFYELGYGITAFGVGPLQAYAGLKLLFGGAALAAVLMAALAFPLAGKSGT